LCSPEDRRRMLDSQHLKEVALELRRRHLRAQHETLKNLRTKMQMARRSRLQRARYLRLARKYQLRRCLERLSEEGLTVKQLLGQPAFQYDFCCEKSIFLGMQETFTRNLKQWWLTRQDSLELQIANLQTLFEECKTSSDDPLEVEWMERDVELEGVWIGDLQVELGLEYFTVSVRNLSVDTEIRGGFQHPHVNVQGEICWNDEYEIAENYHHSGDFLALKDLIHNLLHTYNPDSPYISLEDWVDGLGECCCDCGDSYHEDDMVYVESIDGSLCPNCRYYCEHCDHYQDYHSFNSNWDMCNDCLEDLTRKCTACHERCLVEDLEEFFLEQEDGSPVRLLLCETCYEHHSKKEEETDEDRDGTDGVLASAVAVPAN